MQKSIRSVATALVFGLALFRGLPEARGQELPEKDRIERAVLRERLGTFWGAVLVARGGEPVMARGFGYANDELKEIDADSLFDIASVSKMFTAAAVLKLEMQGKLSTDDAVSEFFEGLPGRASGVTLMHLMNHTSGMSDASAIQRLDFPDRDLAVRKAFESQFATEPGEKFEYCNAGYIVLAAVVEKASGRKFEEYVREDIFQPAGMVGSGFIDGEGLDLSRATLRLTGREWKKSRKTILQDGWGWGLRGAGGVVTSLNDLLAWYRALRGEAVLSNAAKEKMFTAHEPGGYGCGWFLSKLGGGGRQAHHSGGTRGYSAKVSRFLDDDVFVAVLTLEGANPWMMEEVVLNELWPRPKLEAKLHLAGLTLNEHKLAVISEGLRVMVKPGPVPSLLVVEEQGAIRAEVGLSAGQGKKIAAELRRHAREAKAGEGGITGTFAAMPYTIGAGGVVELPEGVEAAVWPQYRSLDSEGRPVVDDRPTLVVVDGEGGFIPIILRMDRSVATKLADELARLD